MTPDQVGLARRAVACKNWRWLPGMVDLYGWRSFRRPQDQRGAVPDLSDPATLGTIIALVREAWGDPRLVAIYCEPAHPGQSEGWVVQAADNRLPVAGEDYNTEAEALVNALERAP